jgi:excisionase family DNA binding protein
MTLFLLGKEKCIMQHVDQNSSQHLLLTINQVMERLQLGRNKVYDLINQEGLPIQRFGRAIRIRPQALEEWLKLRERDEVFL